MKTDASPRQARDKRKDNSGVFSRTCSVELATHAVSRKNALHCAALPCLNGGPASVPLLKKFCHISAPFSIEYLLRPTNAGMSEIDPTTSRGSFWPINSSIWISRGNLKDSDAVLCINVLRLPGVGRYCCTACMFAPQPPIISCTSEGERPVSLTALLCERTNKNGLLVQLVLIMLVLSLSWQTQSVLKSKSPNQRRRFFVVFSRVDLARAAWAPAVINVHPRDIGIANALRPSDVLFDQPLLQRFVPVIEQIL